MLASTRLCDLLLNVLDSLFNISIVVVIVTVVFCSACLTTTIYIKMKLVAKSQPDPDKVTYL